MAKWLRSIPRRVRERSGPVGRHARPTARPSALARTGNELMLTTSAESLRRGADIVAGHRTPPQRQSSLRRKRAQSISRRGSIARCSKQSIKVHSWGEIERGGGFTPRSLQLDNQACRVQVSDLCAWMAGQGGGGTPKMSDPYPSRAQFEITYATVLTTSGPLYSVTHTGLEIGQDEFDDRHARPSVGS